MRLLISSLHFVTELVLCPQVHSGSQEIKVLAAFTVILVGNSVSMKAQEENQFLEAGGVLIRAFRATKRCVGLAPHFLGSDPVLPVQQPSLLPHVQVGLNHFTVSLIRIVKQGRLVPSCILVEPHSPMEPSSVISQPEALIFRVP